MKLFIRFWKGFFLAPAFFIAGGMLVSAFLFSYFFPVLRQPATIASYVIVLLTIADILQLWLPGKKMHAHRDLPQRLSNGDENPIVIVVRNQFPYNTMVQIIDELPPLLQKRDLSFKRMLRPDENTILTYSVRPVQRGDYQFGDIHLFARTPLRLVTRRITIKAEASIPCYPSFIHLRKYELMAVSNRYEETGHRRIQSVGRSYEFDHIRNYALGDDIRSINWKASARRDNLMVNQFRDEKSQQVYCVIDAGRTMQSPFDGMTLLDYAINATLVLSDVAILKNDKAGTLLFSDHIHSMKPCDNKRSQTGLIMDQLYKAETDFAESSYELLTNTLLRKIPRRSLIVLFTHFEGRISLQRQLPYLKQLAGKHVLLTVLFENTLLTTLTKKRATKLSDVYVKAIAEKHSFERRFMAEDLQRNGVIPMLTTPAKLTIDAVNTYIEIKTRKLI